MGKSKEFDKQYRETAEKVKSQIMQQLPALRQNLQSLQQRRKNYIALPIVIHNICIIFEREAYLFLDPAISLYRDGNYEDADMKKAYENLCDLRRKEDELYTEQYKQMELDCKTAEFNGEPFNREAELEAFNHLEADLSPFFKAIIMYVISGGIALNKKQEETMEHVYQHCLKRLQVLIPKKEQALANVDKILGL